MKLSDLSTEKAADVLCDICVYVSNITCDEELMQTLRDSAVESGAKTKAEIMVWFAEKFSSLLPIIFKKHKADVFGMVAVLNGVKPETVAKQNILKTMGQVRDMVKDKELVDFFKSCAQPEKTE